MATATRMMLRNQISMRRIESPQSMIPKTGFRFPDKIMLQKTKARG
jgi:hypothetical protein